jgi:peroxiredoxin Q/BCP
LAAATAGSDLRPAGQVPDLPSGMFSRVAPNRNRPERSLSRGLAFSYHGNMPSRLSTLLLATTLFAAAPQVGQMAPDFTLPSQDGSKISLHDFHGKWVVLYFYPKDGTSGCTLEAHNFQRDIDKYQQLNAEVVGVSVDTADSHKEFCAKQGLHFKLLADTEKKVSESYDSLMMIIHYSSRNTFLISPDGKIAKVWLGVSPAKHSDEVLAALSSLKH